MRNYRHIFRAQLTQNWRAGIPNPKCFYLLEIAERNITLLYSVKSDNFSKLDRYGFSGRYHGSIPKFFVR